MRTVLTFHSMKTRFPALMLLALFGVVAPTLAAPAKPAHRIPVIFVTDIGTDIDDTWALAMILRSPELDLKFVFTDSADTRYRAAIAAKCRFVGMFGSFDKGYGDAPAAAEANVKGDPAALRRVLAAPWRDILLTPLDTCDLVSLTGAKYHAIWSATNDPLLRALIENCCIFAPRVSWMRCDFFATRSTTLFDCVAV